MYAHMCTYLCIHVYAIWLKRRIYISRAGALPLIVHIIIIIIIIIIIYNNTNSNNNIY